MQYQLENVSYLLVLDKKASSVKLAMNEKPEDQK